MSIYLLQVPVILFLRIRHENDKHDNDKHDKHENSENFPPLCVYSTSYKRPSFQQHSRSYCSEIDDFLADHPDHNVIIAGDFNQFYVGHFVWT